MNISEVFLRYGLLVLSPIGLVECIRVFRITLLDKQALKEQRENGGRKLIVETRWAQSAFLMGVFSVLIALGGRIAVSSSLEMQIPLVRTFIACMDVLALLLMIKEQRVLKGRQRLDSYYDHQVMHSHRRKTDIPQLQQRKGVDHGE